MVICEGASWTKFRPDSISCDVRLLSSRTGLLRIAYGVHRLKGPMPLCFSPDGRGDAEPASAESNPGEGPSGFVPSWEVQTESFLLLTSTCSSCQEYRHSSPSKKKTSTYPPAPTLDCRVRPQEPDNGSPGLYPFPLLLTAGLNTSQNLRRRLRQNLIPLGVLLDCCVVAMRDCLMA